MKQSLLLLASILGLGVWSGMRVPPAVEFEHAFERVAESIRPGVVSISSTRRVRLRELDAPTDPFDLFDRAPRDPQLRRFFEDLPGREDERTLRQEVMGSGMIVSSDGLVLTNHQVIAGASDLKVYLADRREFLARVLGTDPRSDLAVIKIEATGLTPVVFGDSDALKVGQWVAAFGSPFGLDQTMSCGIVSAKGRDNLHIADFEDFLQTDAAINPGNSGGPLVDLSGAVIGVNTAIVTRTGGYEGVGLAIPSGMARRIMERLARDGGIVRGWLGVVIQEVTPELGRSFAFPGKTGVLVADVVKSSPAEKAGLVPGDIIETLEGRAVESVKRFRNTIADLKPGTKVALSIWRKEARVDLALELGAAPDGAPTASAEAEARSGFGLELADLTPARRRELGLTAGASGAVVESVAPESSAEEAGLEVGDVIVQIGTQPVDSATRARELLREHHESGASIRVMRAGTAHWVHLDVPRVAR